MAFTKINAAGIGSTELVTLHSLEVLNNATVGGVLTYEDVTNVDSVGLITARNGIVVGSGITLSKDGDIFTTGISTFGGNVQLSGADPEIELNNGGPRFRVPASNTLTIHTGSGLGSANEERVRIHSSGFVGIGTDVPNSYDSGGRTLVLDQGGTLAGMTVRASQQGAIYFADGLSGNEAYRGRIEYKHATDSLDFGTSGTASMFRILSDGQLKQSAASGSTVLTLKRSNTNVSGATGTINFAASDDHSVASIIALGDGDNEGADLSFRTTTAAASEDPYDSSIVERLRITSDGKVGINIDDPDAKLEVRDGGATGIIIRCTNTQSTHVNKAIRVRNNSDTDTFAVSHTGKVFPLDNIVMASGKGIDFSATGDGSGSMSSELLDDYEEGSWTPDIRNDGTTATWGSQQGRYVKIGQQVTVWFNADGGSSPRSGGTSSSLIMTGLPFSQVMFGNPILGSVGANKSSGTGLYSTIGVILSPFGQGGTQVRFGAGGQAINFGIDYVAGCFTYTAS